MSEEGMSCERKICDEQRAEQQIGGSASGASQRASPHNLHSIVFIFLLSIISQADAFSSLSLQSKPLWCCEMKASIETQETDSNSPLASSEPHLVFPGGGIFFYWQAGVVSYLRQQGYALDEATMAGASAGALTATLTASNVDFYEATTLALDLAEEEGVWDRRGGLQGVWGPMIERWLNELLPSNVVDVVDERLSLLVTPVPSFGKSRVSKFADKNDLIRCNMASVHLPVFLDSKFTSMFRERPHIDGSFLAKTEDYLPEGKTPKSVIILDWQSDPAMEGKALEFVSTYSKQAVWDLVELGEKYAKTMDRHGDFESLDRTC